MGKYLKKFETEAAYTAAESSLILPNVSLITENDRVAYKPYTAPIIDGHEYVDLGLPSGTKWARMNIGANSEAEYGNYYQYGKGASQYAATSGQSEYSGTENPLSSAADTVVQVWGGSWHMPTWDQLKELTANTTYEFTTINGINGGKFIAQNGNYVFFPASGYYFNGSQSDVGSGGFYWGSAPNGGSSARLLNINSSSNSVITRVRSNGYSVRGVVD